MIKEAAAQKAAQEKPKGLRVAAYCRVSTDSDEQKTSYRTQKAFYTDMIQRHPGWTFAGIYADEGITGTSRLHRDEFNQMLEDARNGKIDLIVTKSISRFARNTVDTLDCARQLKQLTPPVGIFFEKENINTLDSTSEVILTIYSALAQEESHSISDNIHWSYQKRFQEGKPMVHLSRMIGYDKGENGEWIINEEQAEPVRYLFRRYACGAGRATIIKEMNERGWKTVSGTDWNPSSFSNVILNEKYVGDLEIPTAVDCTDFFLEFLNVFFLLRFIFFIGFLPLLLGGILVGHCLKSTVQVNITQLIGRFPVVCQRHKSFNI